MRRIGLPLLCAIACVAGAATSHATVKRKPKPPARMLVYAQEWQMYGSRSSVPAGRVIVQLWNRGQDAHNLHIRRLNASGKMVGAAQTVKLTGSGAISQATWKLGKGHYELYCSLFQHLQRGMHTRLTVR